jgi:RHS repeat-associated protein
MSTSRTQVYLAMLAGAALVFPSHADAAGSQPEGAPTPTTVKLPSGPGSVRGLADDPAVSVFTGQASYEVPLELPGAARGFAPRVALGYRGDLGNGPLGIGWGIAVPKIVRSSRHGVPRYLATDELELVGVGVGGRLVSIAAGEWRIEGQANSVRVVQNGSGYTVYGPDGTRYQLGVAAGARQEAPGKIAAWLVERITDVAGQVVDFTYQQDQGEVYLDRIAWGSFAAVLERQSRADVITSYALGFPVITAKRVSAIRVESFGEVQRRYELGYDESFAVSRLASVQVIGRGGQDALPQTTFSYAQHGAGTAQLLGTGDWRLDANTVLVDVDGDGAADLLRMTPQGHQYRQNRAGQFAAPVPMTGAAGLTLATSRLADVEGRARANLVTVSSGSWRPYRISGTTWAPLGTWSGTSSVPINGSSIVLAELNGDGRVDAVQWNATGLIVRLGNAAGLDPPLSKPKIGGTALPSANMRWHDVNGDGLSDAVLVQDGNIAAYHGRGDGTFTSPQTIAWPWGGTLGTADVRFADLDRDGLLDLVKVNLGDVAWYRGKAGGGFLSQPVQLAHPAETGPNVIVAIDDANGNGSADVIWSSPTGMHVLDVSGATTAGMLVGIANGMGKTVTISYDATTALAGRDADAGAPWTFQLPLAIPVVIRTVTASGAGDPARTIDFTLRDGFWDATENRFGGFLLGKRIVRGGTGGDLVEETRFHSGTGITRVLRGVPITVRQENGAGNLVSITTNTWRAMPVATLPDTPLLRKAVLDRTTVEHREGTPITTRTSFTIDGEGRTSGEYHEGRIDLVGDEKRLERTFASDATLWVRDLVAEERLLAADGTLVSSRRTYYGDHVAEQPLGAAGRGWARRAESWLASEARWVTQSRREYDSFGNPTRIVEGGVTRDVTYGANGLHAITETLGSLAWSTTWDDVLGLPTAMTGPDGITTRVAYDGLGRVVSESVGSSLPHKVYRYQWTAPRPITETFVFDGALAAVTAVPATWAPGTRWRHEVSIANGAGESLYEATQLDGNHWIVARWTERDAMGRPTYLGDPVIVTGATPVITARPTAMVGQIVARDPMGRAVQQTLADGSIRSFSYTAFTMTTTTPSLAPVTVTRDGLGRPIENRRETELARTRYDAADRATAFDLTRGTQTITHGYAFDSLGRLVGTTHPEAGPRSYTYDDANRRLSEQNATGQGVTTTYDAIGRLATRTLDDGSTFTHHYDAAGRLASVDEPTGSAELAYDELGRITRRSRTVGKQSGTVSTVFAASGLPLSTSFDDGAYDVTFAYDAAGRVIGVGDLWQLAQQDAAGRPLLEQFGNGVSQATERDILGLTSGITITSGQQTLYGVSLEHNAWGGITKISDGDGHGLDHGAVFTYDARGRLAAANLAGYEESFAYDDFQNMVTRALSGPTELGVMTGAYRYGEAGAGPRQLTSIGPTGAPALHTFGYDAAGRQVSVDAKQLTFNALDQLVGIADDTGKLRYAYGFDGEHVETTRMDGSVERWFSADIRETDNGREYLVGIAGRTIARVRGGGAEMDSGAAMAGITIKTVGRIAGMGALALALALALAGSRSQRRRRLACASLAIMTASACGSASRGELSRASKTAQVTYFHQGTAPGPVMFTDEAGAVVEERRHEPFGAPIDHADYASLDQGPLGKPVDAATGWSFHGARWYQPESARWLSVDPPTLEPNAKKYMAEPWALHPYQYVDQNPVLYWDPDGRDKSTFDQSAVDDVLEGIRQKSKRAHTTDDKVSHAIVKAAHVDPALLETTGKAPHSGVLGGAVLGISFLYAAMGPLIIVASPHWEARQESMDNGWRDGFQLGAAAALWSTREEAMKLRKPYTDAVGNPLDKGSNEYAYVRQYNKAITAGHRYMEGSDGFVDMLGAVSADLEKRGQFAEVRKELIYQSLGVIRRMTRENE